MFFFFNAPATTEIYTRSLHDALPIWEQRRPPPLGGLGRSEKTPNGGGRAAGEGDRQVESPDPEGQRRKRNMFYVCYTSSTNSGSEIVLQELQERPHEQLRNMNDRRRA